MMNCSTVSFAVFMRSPSWISVLAAIRMFSSIWTEARSYGLVAEPLRSLLDGSAISTQDQFEENLSAMGEDDVDRALDLYKVVQGRTGQRTRRLLVAPSCSSTRQTTLRRVVFFIVADSLFEMESFHSRPMISAGEWPDWVPPQLKGCLLECIIKHTHNAIGGVAMFGARSHGYGRPLFVFLWLSAALLCYEDDGKRPPVHWGHSSGPTPFVLGKCVYASSFPPRVTACWWIPAGDKVRLCGHLCVTSRFGG